MTGQAGSNGGAAGDGRVVSLPVLLEALALRPCHVTGMHKPEHHLRYVCEHQRAEAFERLLDLLGIAESDLPRHLHDNCGWCTRIPTQEQYREATRRTYRWAGLPVPPELAQPAADASISGDDETLLELIPAEWSRFYLEADVTLGWPGTRRMKATQRLIAAGLVEEKPYSNPVQYRRIVAEPAASDAL